MDLNPSEGSRPQADLSVPRVRQYQFGIDLIPVSDIFHLDIRKPENLCTKIATVLYHMQHQCMNIRSIHRTIWTEKFFEVNTT